MIPVIAFTVDQMVFVLRETVFVLTDGLDQTVQNLTHAFIRFASSEIVLMGLASVRRVGRESIVLIKFPLLT